MSLFHKNPRFSNTTLNNREEIDWAHRTVIHHVKYAFPKNYTHCGEYPTLDSDAFQDAVQKAKDIVRSLNLNIQSAGVLENIIRLAAAKIMVQSIIQTRSNHHLQALQLRSDLEYQLQNHLAQLKLLQTMPERIQKEIDKLQ